MSLSDNILAADTQWISIEDDPELLAIEIDHWLNHRAMLEGDLAAGDGDVVILQNGIDYATVTIAKLLKQGERLARAMISGPYRDEPLDLAAIRDRMDAAKKLDPEVVVERVAGIWLTQRKAGGDLWGLCPLPGHDEKTASFHIDADGRWYCFGCRRGGGDVVSFAAAFLGRSQMQGLIYLEELFGR